MKKTYIEPKTTIVALNVRDNVLQAGSINEISGISGLGKGNNTTDGNVTDADAREVIRPRDAWEEW